MKIPLSRKLTFFVFKLLMTVLTRIEVHGLEHIPPQGGALLAFNHLSRIDSAIVFTSIPRPEITGWVAEKYERYWIMRLLVRILDGIFIDRFNPDLTALRTALDFLKEGRMLAIAPEGTRSPDGTLKEGKEGVAYLAAQSGAPVIPMGMDLPQDVVRRALTLRRPLITLQIAPAISIPRPERGQREAILQAATDEIMCQIAALIPAERRGDYAEHPRTHELAANNVARTRPQ